MFQVDFNTPKHVHFIGIGGISMSGLAEILLGKGFRISGSDNNASALTERLEKAGAVIRIGQSADNISPDTDLVVYTAAIHPDNPEFVAAKKQGIPMLSRAQLLGQIMQNYDLPINIAGTHGKTTTTSMCTHVLMRAGLDPTVTLGGILPSIGGNIRVGGTKYFVAEACEYTNSFLSFFPKIELILNVDADHLDFFKDLDDIASSFHRFAALLPEDGTLIINRDTAKYDVVTDHLACGIITYSLNGDADYTAEDVHFNENGCASFVCLERGKPIGNFRLCIPGMHSVSNSLAVIALSRKLGLSPEIIALISTGPTAASSTREQLSAPRSSMITPIIRRKYGRSSPQRCRRLTRSCGLSSSLTPTHARRHCFPNLRTRCPWLTTSCFPTSMRRGKSIRSASLPKTCARR